jgi:hypothetical protein
MCREHQQRGFWRGRHGIPSREESVERLHHYREHLQGELAKIEELLARLEDPAATPTE